MLHGTAKATDGLIPAPEAREQRAEIVQGLRVLGLERQRTLVRRIGVLQLALFGKHIGEVEMRVRRVGPQMDNTSITRRRLIQLALLLQRIAEIKMRVGIIRL